MESGKNVSPQWAPDGKSIAFVSDRSGVSNIYLYDLGEERDLPAHRPLHRRRRASRRSRRCSPGRATRTGSPSCTTRQGKYDVYTITNPRALKRHAVPASRRWTASASWPGWPPRRSTRPGRLQVREEVRSQVGEGGLDLPDAAGIPLARASWPATGDTTQPSAAGLDRRAARLGQLQPAGHQRVHAQGLPGPLHARLHRAPVHRLRAGQLRARLLRRLGHLAQRHPGQPPARLRRLRQRAHRRGPGPRGVREPEQADQLGGRGCRQDPYYFLEPSADPDRRPRPGENIFVTNIRRLIVRSVFAQAYYPISRFQRFEAGRALRQRGRRPAERQRALQPRHGVRRPAIRFYETINLPGVNYVQPSRGAGVRQLAVRLRRARSTAAATVSSWRRPSASWRFTQVTADYRRYDAHRRADRPRHSRPLLRPDRAAMPSSSASSSAAPTWCAATPRAPTGATNASTPTTPTPIRGARRSTGWWARQIAVGKRRAPLPDAQPDRSGCRRRFPPIEGALFFDIGLAWDESSTLKWSRELRRRPGQRPDAAPGPSASSLAGQPLRLRRGAPRLRDSLGPPWRRGGFGPSVSDPRSRPMPGGAASPSAAPLSALRPHYLSRVNPPRRGSARPCSLVACGRRARAPVARQAPASTRAPAPSSACCGSRATAARRRLYRVPSLEPSSWTGRG